MKKKVLALLTVLVMVLSIVAVPNVSANADEAAQGTVDFLNHWWSDSTKIVCYSAENSTIQAVEDIYYPNGGFPWYKAIIMDMNEDGMYEVTDIIAADGSNEKGAITLTTGRVVIMYHETAADTASLAFYNSLQEGDLLLASVPWATIAACQAVPVFTKATTQGSLNIANGIGDATTVGTLIAALAPNNANATIDVLTAGTEFAGLPYWYTIVLEKNATSGAWVVKETDFDYSDALNTCKDEPLGEGKMIVAFHDLVTDKASAAFFLATATVGQEYYLVGEIPAAGGALDGVYLTLEAPAPTPDPEPTPNPDEPGDEITPAGDFDTMATTALMMVSVALVGVVLVLKKRNNVA